MHIEQHAKTLFSVLPGFVSTLTGDLRLKCKMQKACSASFFSGSKHIVKLLLVNSAVQDNKEWTNSTNMYIHVDKCW